SACPASSLGPAEMPVAKPGTVCAATSSLTVTVGVGRVNVGASLTAFTVIVNVWVVDVSDPPLAVPPLSFNCTVMVAVPLAFAAGVNVSVPSGAIDGATANRPAFVFPVTLNVSACPDSSAGPALMPVANPATVCGPASSFTVTVVVGSVKLGASLTAVT